MDWKEHKLFWEKRHKNDVICNVGYRIFWVCTMLYYLVKIVEECIDKSVIGIIVYAVFIGLFVVLGLQHIKTSRKQQENHERMMELSDSIIEREEEEVSEDGNETD